MRVTGPKGGKVMRKIGIVKGSPDECLVKLREEQLDLTDFPLRLKAETLSILRILGAQVMVVEGSVLHPTGAFEVPLRLSPDVKRVPGFSRRPPGVVPYVNSARQVTGRNVIPSPRDVGVPLLTTEVFLVIWPLRPDGKRQIGNRDYILWASISEEEAISLFSAKARGKDELRQILSRIEEMRRGTAKPTFAHTFPEPVEAVEERLTKKIYEPEKARCLEAMSAWRVIVPSTTKDVVSLPVPACFTVIGDVFNIIITGDPCLTISIAAVLNTAYVRDYLTAISSWVRGETPRVRVREVAVALNSFADKIGEISTRAGKKLCDTGALLQRLFEAQVSFIAELIGEGVERPVKVSELYRACSAVPGKSARLRGVISLDEESLSLRVGKNTVELKFGDPDQVADAALLAWLCAGAALSFREFLEMPLPRLIDFRTVHEAFMEMPFKKLVGLAESLF